jgi:hypothetical protein
VRRCAKCKHSVCVCVCVSVCVIVCVPPPPPRPQLCLCCLQILTAVCKYCCLPSAHTLGSASLTADGHTSVGSASLTADGHTSVGSTSLTADGHISVGIRWILFASSPLCLPPPPPGRSGEHTPQEHTPIMRRWCPKGCWLTPNTLVSTR